MVTNLQIYDSLSYERDISKMQDIHQLKILSHIFTLIAP